MHTRTHARRHRAPALELVIFLGQKAFLEDRAPGWHGDKCPSPAGPAVLRPILRAQESPGTGAFLTSSRVIGRRWPAWGPHSEWQRLSLGWWGVTSGRSGAHASPWGLGLKFFQVDKSGGKPEREYRDEIQLASDKGVAGGRAGEMAAVLGGPCVHTWSLIGE